MKYNTIFYHASRLREVGNTFIVSELNKAGLPDIAPSHGDILAQLLTCESRNMSELAQKGHRSKSTVTTLVTKLEKAGFVERIPDPADSRGVMVRLTARGRELGPTFDRISDGLNHIITSRLSNEEASILQLLLSKCVD